MIEPLVVIVGPTASGKSAFAMQVAKKFNGEIICADSRTIYKGMDIGTAKPSRSEQSQIRHHLLDVVNPDEVFTAADFKRLTNRAISDIASRGKLPIMVGGSGLYVDSVIFDYQFGKPADQKLRRQLSAKTAEQLQDICRQNNIELPENPTNKRYLVRAIESGGVINGIRELRASTIVVGISTEKDELKKRIEQRAAIMLKRGVIEEVSKLGSVYGWDGEAMKGNIYRILRGVVEGKKNVDIAIQEFIASDMRLVKKQLTWFKRNPNIIWGKSRELLGVIEQFLKAAEA